MDIEIKEDDTTYEGIRAVPAMMMAMMECTGIRKMIDNACRKIDEGYYDLTPGMAVKAMVGAAADHGRKPLYLLGDYYSTAPVDLLFGKGVEHRSLSDTIFAARLDTISRLDMRSVLLKAYNMLKKRYGFTSVIGLTEASDHKKFGLDDDERWTVSDASAALNGIAAADQTTGGDTPDPDTHMDTPHTRNRSRILATEFVVTLTEMLCAVADHVLKEKKEKGEGRHTIKALSDIHMNTLVWYIRRKHRMLVTGREGDTARIFELIRRLEVDPKYLLTC